MIRIASFLILSAGTALAGAAGDAKRGAMAFRPCMACHSVKEGEHMTGPSLAHVWGRRAASAVGFERYSDALRNSGITWNESTLEKWLAAPEALVPGNSMTFPGIRQQQAREDLVAYLKAAAENKAPIAQGGAMGGMHGGRAELRKAPPQGLVKSITYCRDTYTVQTADGKSARIWEFNLRFKSDSSKQGPEPGKPVVVGAGMQGDRASVVFASPREISQFVKVACP
jgi:cytochrome c